MNNFKYAIIGAGLSGLTTAYQLYKSGETDFIILESRDRVGGRIFTHSHIDFGATWFHSHHENLLKLVDDLGIPKFHQYNSGKSILVYSSMAPAHYFDSDPKVPSAYRIAGGSSALINELKKPISSAIRTSQIVDALEEKGDLIHIRTKEEVYMAQKVVVTIPPKIATRVDYIPKLPETTFNAMNKTHTWMSNAIKIGMTFKVPFWKENGLSGTMIGQVGAVVELYDHTDYENKHFALMGFVNEALRDVSAKVRKERILEYLRKYFGNDVMDYLFYEEKDWSKDWNTSCEKIKSIYMSPSYGNPVFNQFYMNDKLLFSGAETSPLYGGYMDGAIFSGLNTAERLIENKS